MATPQESSSTDAPAVPAPITEPPPPLVWPKPLVEDFTDRDWPDLQTTSDEDVVKWVMTNKRLLIRTVTWNLCAKPPPNKESLTQSLIPPHRFHLYIIGTEECERSIAQSALNPSKKNWEGYLREVLGPNYLPLRSHTLQAIHVMAFIHKGLASLCTMATSAAVACGAGNTLGNKGAVGVLLRIGSVRIVVVNAHLSAHQGAVSKRNAEFHKINRTLPALLTKKESFLGGKSALDLEGSGGGKMVGGNGEAAISPSDPAALVAPPVVAVTASPLSPQPQVEGEGGKLEIEAQGVAEEDSDDEPEEASTSPTPSANNILTGKTLDEIADFVVFMGDLNYRINGNRSVVNKLLASEMHEVMLSNDQLRVSMAAGLVFPNFIGKSPRFFHPCELIFLTRLLLLSIEPPLNFRPTYKFDLNSDVYDSGPKSRVPSWTDRILYVPNSQVQCLAYNSDTSIRTSDHRPVYASFLLNFHAYVKLDEQKEAILPVQAVQFTSESQVCSIS